MYLMFIFEMFFFSLPASSKHCASSGAVCQARRAERRKCLHVRQVSVIRLSPSNPLFILHRNRLSPLHLYGLENSVDALRLHLFLCRCKKKVPATKRFTVHRTSNVLTLSLKRFANFSGGKITKVNKTFSTAIIYFEGSITLFSISYFCDILLHPASFHAM